MQPEYPACRSPTQTIAAGSFLLQKYSPEFPHRYRSAEFLHLQYSKYRSAETDHSKPARQGHIISEVPVVHMALKTEIIFS